MKKRYISYVLILVLICLGLAYRYAPRSLLRSSDTVCSILDVERGFRVLHGGSLTGVDVTELVDMYGLFDLLSQTTIRRSNNWYGTYGADWVLWDMGSSRGPLRGRVIAFWGAEGQMIGEVGFGSRTFRLSNAGEILVFLEQSIMR